MATIVSPALRLDLLAPGTNPRLFWTREHNSVVSPLPTFLHPTSVSPWVLPELGPAAQTDGALCASGQTCLPLSPSQFYCVYTGNYAALLAS
ncbi:hypothetical protein CesoFtcFv8_019551 [Champsocephalus esox]|uniref:Uncharacterized protein n=1 Tax=Champsocephalus esox TaxID=159716 RepID=A0AAN8GMR9_9TELE|nr:hypothetical protein CesoFtcFv8_019551 [Champsocephalus esox]